MEESSWESQSLLYQYSPETLAFFVNSALFDGIIFPYLCFKFLKNRVFKIITGKYISTQWRDFIGILSIDGSLIQKGSCLFLCFQDLIELVTVSLLFRFSLGPWITWGLSFRSMEPIPSALEGKVFTTGPPGESQGSCFLSLGGMRKTRSGSSHHDPGPLALSTLPFVSLSVRRC